MTLGLTPKQGDLLRSTVSLCEGRVGSGSIYGVLHRGCFTLFPDEMFADLFTDVGRRSVPPMIVAVVMVLQRIEGSSDREAVGRFAFDARWKYAAGGLDFDYPGFVHTVLVDMRARLAASASPDRIFEVTLDAARKAGLVGRKRVLDSTPLYDAVATMDTVTLIRSGIRGVLKAAGTDLEAQLRAVIGRVDDYAAAGKPVCDYDDPTARKVLIDALAKDAMGLLAVLDGHEPVTQARKLLATLVGSCPQLLEQFSVVDGMRAEMGWIEDEKLSVTTFDLAASVLIIDLDRAVVVHAPRGCHRRHPEYGIHNHGGNRYAGRVPGSSAARCWLPHLWFTDGGRTRGRVSGRHRYCWPAGSVIVTEPAASGPGNAPQPHRERMVNSASRSHGTTGPYSRISGGLLVQQIWMKRCHGIGLLLAPA